MSTSDRFKRLLERRCLRVPLAVIIGCESGWLLWVTLRRDYWDYWLYPKLKAADFYIYPQLRYTFFDSVLLLWCLDGLIVCGLSLCGPAVSHGVAGWTYRTAVLYVVLLVLLILGGSLMLLVRNLGF